MLPTGNRSPRRENPQTNAADRSQEELTCLNCRKAYRPGELVCTNCGMLFFNTGETQRLDSSTEPALVGWSRGDAIITDQRPIIFAVDDQDILLPVANSIVVGRVGSAEGSAPPDVDLTTFDAKAKGVSRLHLRVVRQSSLIYVADMGSSNGSFLNGRRLFPEYRADRPQRR